MNALRGKCKEVSEKYVQDNPDSNLVRGFYHCPYWGKQQHWWVKDKSVNIIDLTAEQFPSNGDGEYEEFAGNVECSECGKEGNEEDFKPEGRYIFCSSQCYGKFVGLI